MSIFEAIVNYFNEHIDNVSGSIETLTPYLAEAANLMSHTLIQNQKILTVSSPICFSAGHQFNTNLLSHTQLLRPALPSIFLNHANIANAACQSPETLFSQQVSALGHKGDLLFLLSSSGNEQALLNCIDSALQRQMNIISINTGEAQEIALNTPKDQVHIKLSSHTPMQASNIQFLVSQLLSDLVEQQLFGGAL